MAQAKPKATSAQPKKTKQSFWDVKSKPVIISSKDDPVDVTVALAALIFTGLYIFSFPLMNNMIGERYQPGFWKSTAADPVKYLVVVIMFFCLWRVLDAAVGSKLSFIAAIALSAVLTVVFGFVSFMLYFGSS